MDFPKERHFGSGFNWIWRGSKSTHGKTRKVHKTIGHLFCLVTLLQHKMRSKKNFTDYRAVCRLGFENMSFELSQPC